MTDLATERAAYMAGFGDGAALIDAVRSAELVMLLDADGRVYTYQWAGLPWLTAFTDPARCRRFVEAVGRDAAAVKICTLRGSAVVDGLLDRAPTPTGLVLDVASPDAFVFPPVPALTPHRYIDVDTGKVVMK